MKQVCCNYPCCTKATGHQSGLCKEHRTKPARARLDADRTARPKTRIVAHARAGDCAGPWAHEGNRPEYEDEDGKRIPLTRK